MYIQSGYNKCKGKRYHRQYDWNETKWIASDMKSDNDQKDDYENSDEYTKHFQHNVHLQQ